MLYLSELIGKPVYTTDHKLLGKLSDVVFITSEVPYITKLQVKAKHNQRTLYPITTVRDINGSIVLKEPVQVPLGENEVYMVQNLLDQQIIDIKGKNIVRVNDVVIIEKPQFTVSGIDIGITGILRWFYIEKLLSDLLRRPLKHTLLPWSEIQPLEIARGKVVLNKEENKLKSIAPEDLADYLENTTISNAMKILELVNHETASEVIQNLNINFQTQIFRQMKNDTAARIITYADPDEATDLLFTVSDEKREHILSLVSEEKRKEIKFLISHAHTDIGELMTTEFLIFQPEDTVKSVMDRIKKETRGYASLAYCYVVNKKQEFIGVASLHELLLQPTDMQMVKFMSQNVVVVHTTTPINVAIKRMLKFKLRSIPVLDADRKILGIVTLDDIAEPFLEKL